MHFDLQVGSGRILGSTSVDRRRGSTQNIRKVRKLGNAGTRRLTDVDQSQPAL